MWIPAFTAPTCSRILFMSYNCGTHAVKLFKSPKMRICFVFNTRLLSVDFPCSFLLLLLFLLLGLSLLLSRIFYIHSLGCWGFPCVATTQINWIQSTYFDSSTSLFPVITLFPRNGNKVSTLFPFCKQSLYFVSIFGKKVATGNILVSKQLCRSLPILSTNEWWWFSAQP